MYKRQLRNPAPAQRLPAELYKYTDIIVLNEHEASQISEISDINDYEKCIDILTERGIPQVIVTWGEKGSVFNFNGKKAKVPAFKVNAVEDVYKRQILCPSINMVPPFKS